MGNATGSEVAAHLPLRFVFLGFALFGCSNFYLSENLLVKRVPILRFYGAILVISFFAYYCYRFHPTREFFVGRAGQLNLIYFEFNFYWFATILSFILILPHESAVAEWHANVIRKILLSGSSNLAATAAVLLFNYLANVVVLSVYVPVSYLGRNQPDMSNLAPFVYYVLCYILAIISFQFTTGILFLLLLLRAVSCDLLRTLRDSSESHSENKTKCEYQRLDTLRRIREITARQHEYYLLAVEYNEYFGVQLLLINLLVFVELTYSLFYMLTEIDSTTIGLFVKSEAKFIFAMCYFTFYLIQFLQNAISCELFKDENDKIMATVNNALSNVEDRNLQDALEALLLQGGNLQPTITAAGFFSINNRLIFKMMGMVTSTLVILFQFSKVPPKISCPQNETIGN